MQLQDKPAGKALSIDDGQSIRFVLRKAERWKAGGIFDKKLFDKEMSAVTEKLAGKVAAAYSIDLPIDKKTLALICSDFSNMKIAEVIPKINEGAASVSPESFYVEAMRVVDGALDRLNDSLHDIAVEAEIIILKRLK